MGIVNDAVEDRVAECWVPYDVVPKFDGDLAGNDGRGATMAIIEDLQKVAPFGGIEYRQAPIIEDEELNAPEGFEQAAIAAVATSESERFEEARCSTTIWMGTQRQSGWPFRRSRREDDCRGRMKTQAIFA